MKLRINGQETIVPDELKVISDLVHHFNLHDKTIMIEHNEDILEKNSYDQSQLCEGDKIEIVHFVGGG